MGSSHWIRRMGATGPGDIRMVCFPHAGGSSTFFAGLARALAPEVEVLGVQYPGRQDRHREQPVEDIARMAEAVHEELGALLSDGRPCAFFGHSMGALVAFETALLLRGGQPSKELTRLFASGRAAPLAGPRPGDLLSGDKELLTELHRLGGVGKDVLGDPELVSMIMPAVRADYRALATYGMTPGAALDCPVTVLTGEADPIVSPEEAAQWQGLTSAPTEMRVFPGGHFYLQDQVQQVAAAVRESLLAS
ncbi:thioesterase [Streptomyces longisporoflavus]|uniref:thioesterase II family protein n=1 Tax=Streptomyces longisporoflavus TaxID=28044 RepID=UPI00167C6948|nr:alpha/beta fold hydrolase [Streptomyces longisporoflavus]GGV73279.1 thioesterase [Streptomyces longisporoflavus]